MSSVDGQNPWPLYDPYKDCSQGICSIYCRQWCYVIFPPPPPFTLEDGGSGTDFSPLVIAIIGILASAFILVSYYTIISKYCWRRGQDDSSLELNENHDQTTNEALQGTSGGLDESLIKSITICNYKKGDGFVEETDCSVCLSEFQENESLRLLPKCSHAFHVPCIDTWLKSNASCPLCRANIVFANLLPSQVPGSGQENQSNTNVSTLEYQQRSNDAVIVVQNLQGSVHEEAAVSPVVGDDVPKCPFFQGLGNVQSVQPSENMIEIRQDPIQQMRRSVSLNFAACQNQLSIADVLDISEEGDADDYCQIRETEKYRSGIFNLVRSPLATKRSISTGRYMFNGYEKGRSSTLPC